MSCECSNVFGNLIECDDATKTARIRRNIWLGRIGDDTNYYAIDCPDHYCSVRNVTYTPLDEDTKMCANNRIGIICGQCEDGFGAVVNSRDYECIVCNSTNLIGSIVEYITCLCPFGCFLYSYNFI